MDKKIRFLKVTAFYDNYLNIIYDANSHLKECSYSVQYKTIMDDCFAWSDFWKKNLESTGQFEATEIIANAHLQKTWAIEHNFNYDHDDWQRSILAEQIQAFQPDIVFIDEFSICNVGFRKTIKKECPSIKLMLAWDGIALNDTNYFQDIDLILSCVEFVVDFYNKNGIPAFFYRFGFEKTILEKIKLNREKHKTSFVGSINLMKGGHFGRLNLLNKLSSKTELDLYLTGNSIKAWHPLRYSQRQRILNGDFKEFIQIYRLGRKNQGEAFGLKMYQILADSKISLNKHIDLAQNKAANIRLVEATGVGSCLLTDHKDNICDYFEPDKEIVVYSSPEDCVDKIKYLLDNDNVRKEIAKNGQRKTLSSYTFEQNVHKFAEYLLNKYSL